MSIRPVHLEQVKKTLKWKKSDKKNADKLGMILEYYKELKEELRKNNYKTIVDDVADMFQGGIIDTKHNLDRGTAEYKAISTTEPQTSEEIIELLKLDTSKWKLSSYWNKQQSNGTWLISAQVTQIKETVKDVIENALVGLEFEYIPLTVETFINTKHDDDTCAVLSLQDIHIGKDILDGTTPEYIVESVQNCIKSLVMRAYHSNKLDKIIFVLGGDLVNMDTYLGTTTSGTPVDNSMEAYQAYKMAFDLMFWSVNYLKQFCNELDVVYIPGNHSRLTEAHIAYSLSKSVTDPTINWDIEYAERKVLTYGSSMLCFEHGDKDTRKSFYVFATEYAKEWGNTEHRVLYTGHYHKEKTIQYITRDETNGFTIKILPSLSKTDKFHYSGKWTMNKRGGIIELYSKSKGCTGAFHYYE